MEIVLKILEVIGTVIIAYFSIGFILIWGCWPVNDKQENAPFWVLGRLIAKPFKLLWKGLRRLTLMAKVVFNPIGCNDDVEVLTGKYKGYKGYVIDIGLDMVAVRLQTGYGWYTFNYKHKNVKKL